VRLYVNIMKTLEANVSGVERLMAEKVTTQVLPLVLVDIDSVLGDANGLLLRIIEREFGCKCTRDQITHWYLSDCLPITQEQENDLFAKYFFNELLDMELVDGTLAGLSWLAQRAMVWLVTARPAHCDGDTIDWLLKHDLPHHGLTLHAGCKTTLLAEHSIDLVIEDKGSTAVAFAERGVPVILFDYPYNRDVVHPLVRRVSGWKDAVEILQTLMKENP